MKSTAEYINILRGYMAKNASKYSITRMGIFGSVARGEQTEDSDVDVYLETSKPSMFALVHIKDDLQTLFGCNVDIVRLRDHMDSFLRSRIEKEGIYVWYRANILNTWATTEVDAHERTDDFAVLITERSTP